MRFTVLGPCRAFDGGSEIVLDRSAAIVMPILVANANRTVPVQTIANTLSPFGIGHDADSVLRSLGDAIGQGVIERTGENVSLRCEPLSIDSWAFEDELSRARFDTANTEHAAQLVASALGRWYGDAYDGCPDPVVRSEVARLDALRSDAEDFQFDLLLGQRRYREALDVARAMVEREPLREGAAHRHIVALYRNKRRAEAFRTLHALGDELALKGQGPSPALEALEIAMIVERDVPHSDERSRRIDIGGTDDRDDEGQPASAFDRGLVGRWPERRLLRAFVRDVEEGSARIAVMEGSAGVGKTRLAKFLGDEARRRGWEILNARCDERFEAPFWPLSTVLLPRLVAEARLDPQLRVHVGVLDEMIDARKTSLSQARPIPERYDALRQVLLSIARKRPVLVLVDDTQWADPSTLDLLVSAARMLSDAPRERTPIAIVIVARSGADPAHAKLLDQFLREPITTRMVLRGLSEAEVSQLVRSLGVSRLSPRVTAELTRITQGNPLFVEAAVRRCADLGDKLSGADVVASLPAEISSALLDHLHQLTPAAYEVARLAAIIGEPWDLDLLTELSGLSKDQLLNSIELLLDHGVATVEGRDVRFSHPLYEQIALSEINPLRRQRLHAQVAEQLLTRDPGISSSELVRHYSEAGDFVDRARAQPVIVKAAQQSEALFAWSEAAKCYDLALDWLSPEEAHDAFTRGKLLQRAGAARLRNGEPVLALRMLEWATACLEGVDNVALAQAWISRIQAEAVLARPPLRFEAGRLEELAEELQDESPALAAEVWANLAQLFWTSGRIDLARAAVDRAIDLATGADAAETIVWACWNRAMTEWAVLDLQAAAESLRLAKRYGSRARDRKQLTGPAMRLPLCLFWLGDVAGAALAESDAEALSLDVNYTMENGLFLAARALRQLSRGLIDDAEESGAACLLAQASTGYVWATALALPLLARARLLRLDEVGLAGVIARWVRPGSIATHRFTADCVLAMLDAGRPLPEAPTALPIRLGSDTAAAIATELAFERNEPAFCAAVNALLSTLAARGQQFTTTMGHFLPRIQAMAQSLRNEPDAEAALELAIRIAADEKLRLEVANGLYALGIHLHRHRRHNEAARHLAEAQRVARMIGAIWLATRCEAVLERDEMQEHTRDREQDQAANEPETVIILFVDIVESSALTERMGDRAFRAKARALDEAFRALVQEHRGRAATGVTLGDGILADFGTARDALTCAFACADRAEQEGLPVHLGLHAGDVLRERGSIFGGAVNIAARVCDLSRPSEVLVSQTFRDLSRTSGIVQFEDRGQHQLKGVSEPVRVYAIGTNLDDSQSQ
jgi:class 3 adenylate cyclase